MGSVLALGEKLLWTYVWPVGDVPHHACVMVWDEQQGARPWLVSRHQASDWLLAPDGAGGVYLVERRYLGARDAHEIRLLHAQTGEEPTELYPWAADPDRVGAGGFAVLGEDALLYARYPGLFTLSLDGTSLEGTRQPWEADGPDTVLALRRLADGRLLLRGEDEIWLVGADGAPEHRWTGLLEEGGETPSIGGNQLFDADLGAGGLWVAYWGRRRFERHDAGGRRRVLLQLQAPWVPHGVAVNGHEAFMLASSIEPGVGIEPRLWRWKDGRARLIWDGSAATVVGDSASWGRIKQQRD